MKFFRRKRSLFGSMEIFQKRRRPHKKKGDEIDDFVKVVVTVHPFR